jgi:hypothetical protein
MSPNICNSCGNYLRGHYNTMISTTEAGLMILSYICDKCIKDQKRINSLIKDVDRQLNEFDYEKTYGVS